MGHGHLQQAVGFFGEAAEGAVLFAGHASVATDAGVGGMVSEALGLDFARGIDPGADGLGAFAGLLAS